MNQYFLLKTVIVFMSLFSFFGCNQAKDDGVRHPEESFSLLEATDANGGRVILMANMAYQGFAHTAEFPWMLNIQVPIAETNPNGHPTDPEAKYLNILEDALVKQLEEVAKVHFLSRTTMPGLRELVYYIDTPEKVEEVLLTLNEEEQIQRQLGYSVESDPKWTNVDYFLRP